MLRIVWVKGIVEEDIAAMKCTFTYENKPFLYSHIGTTFVTLTQRRFPLVLFITPHEAQISATFSNRKVPISLNYYYFKGRFQLLTTHVQRILRLYSLPQQITSQQKYSNCITLCLKYHNRSRSSWRWDCSWHYYRCYHSYHSQTTDGAHHQPWYSTQQCTPVNKEIAIYIYSTINL